MHYLISDLPSIKRSLYLLIGGRALLLVLGIALLLVHLLALPLLHSRALLLLDVGALLLLSGVSVINFFIRLCRCGQTSRVGPLHVFQARARAKPLVNTSPCSPLGNCEF